MRSERIKISVIIPVYNSEAYLSRCVSSVLRQTYAGVELILVDDGATDGSGQICDAFAAADLRVRVLHQRNRGQSAARNAGIRMVSGDYLTFLDSDDYWIRDTALEEMCRKLDEEPQSDLVMFGFTKVWKRTGKRSDRSIATLPAHTADPIFALLKAGAYSNSACNKLIRRQFVQDHALYFREGFLCEDVEWCGKLIRMGPGKPLLFPQPIMVYEIKANSSSAPKEKSYLDFMRILSDELESIGELDDEYVKRKSFAYWAEQMSWFLGIPTRIGRDCGRLAEKECADKLPLFDYAASPKTKLVGGCIKALGLKQTMRLLGWCEGRNA